MHIRVASASDLDAVVRIQTLAYGMEFNEPAEALLAKLMLAKQSSFVALHGESVAAYAIAFPWTSGEPVRLHSIDLATPTSPNCMYIHDVAVNPELHRRGIAQELVNAILQRAEELALHHCELVAVQNSEEFWEKYGFRKSGIAGPEYGVGAIKMKR